MNINTKYITTCLALALLTLLVFLPEFDLLAQCPMCKASAEASIKEGESTALGLNTGILYLLAFPYVLVTTLGVLFYLGYRKKKKREERLTQAA